MSSMSVVFTQEKDDDGNTIAVHPQAVFTSYETAQAYAKHIPAAWHPFVEPLPKCALERNFLNDHWPFVVTMHQTGPTEWKVLSIEKTVAMLEKESYSRKLGRVAETESNFLWRGWAHSVKEAKMKAAQAAMSSWRGK